MNNKKILALVLSFVMLFALGCSTNTKPENANSNQSATSDKTSTQGKDTKAENNADKKQDTTANPIKNNEKTNISGLNTTLNVSEEFRKTVSTFPIDNEKYKNEDPNFSPSKGYLYKITKGDDTVYLLGSIHLFSPNYYPLRSEIMDAYKASKSLSFECLNLFPGSDKVTEKAMANMMFTDGKALKDVVPADLYEELKLMQSDMQIPAYLLTQFKPVFAAMNIEAFLAVQSGYDANSGIDMFFERRAVKDGKPTYEIEGTLQQVEMLDKISQETQNLVLKETMESTRDLETYGDLFEFWKNGDETSILSSLKDSESFKNKEYKDIMLTNRNIGMSDYIIKMLDAQDGSTNMVIVGALHVVGDDGIAEMLKKAGYKVEKQ